MVGSTAQLRAALSHPSIGSPSMVLQSATSAAFDEFCATERWCCFPFQPEPIDRTSTAQSIAVSQQTASDGLYHETFKCGLVSEKSLFLKKPTQARWREKIVFNPHTASETYTITFRPLCTSSVSLRHRLVSFSARGFLIFPPSFSIQPRSL